MPNIPNIPDIPVAKPEVPKTNEVKNNQISD